MNAADIIEHAQSVQTVCAVVGCAALVDRAVTWWKKRAPLREARRARRRARRADRRADD